MKIKALVIDFDGAITTEDLLSLLCELVGKKVESEKLEILFREGKFKGLEGLIRRINFLKGLSLEQIKTFVSKNDYFQKGVMELFEFLKSNNIISIIASGNVLPLLEIYKEKLGADYLIGSEPIIQNGLIVSISDKEYSGIDFKVRNLKEILKKLDISPDNVIAIGDSPADKGLFETSAKSIAFNPKAGIEQYSDYVVYDDLSKTIPVLKNLMSS